MSMTTSRVNFNVDSDLYKQFKQLCSDKDTKVTDEFTRFMKVAVAHGLDKIIDPLETPVTLISLRDLIQDQVINYIDRKFIVRESQLESRIVTLIEAKEIQIPTDTELKSELEKKIKTIEKEHDNLKQTLQNLSDQLHFFSKNNAENRPSKKLDEGNNQIIKKTSKSKDKFSTHSENDHSTKSLSEQMTKSPQSLDKNSSSRDKRDFTHADNHLEEKINKKRSGAFYTDRDVAEEEGISKYTVSSYRRGERKCPEHIASRWQVAPTNDKRWVKLLDQ